MQRPSILIVDDDPLTRKLLRVALQREGYQVLEAENGRTAVELMSIGPPDLILQDLILPDVDGLELVRRLRALPGGAIVPILALSGFISRMGDAEHRHAGFTGYIAKPVQPSELVAIVRTHVPPPAATPGERAPEGQEPQPSLPAAEEPSGLGNHLQQDATAGAGVTNRLAWIEAKLAILTGLAETLKRSSTTEPLIDEILYRALEVVGAPRGAAFLLDDDGQLSLRTDYGYRNPSEGGLPNLFGHIDLLLQAMREKASMDVPSAKVADEDAADLLTRAGAHSMLIVPVCSVEECFGCIVLAWPSPEREDDWRSLIPAVVGQVSQAVALTRAMARLSESERRLGHLQTIVDTALAHLTLDDLLPELMSRISKAVASDTVAILLLEGDCLVAHAALGLEEEVLQGVRIPIGKGFAGRVLAQQRPIAIHDLGHAHLINPVLQEKGIRSVLGVPLLVEERVIGVLHVGRLLPRRFSEGDVQLLQLVADRVASAMDRARLYSAEQNARSEAEAAQQRMAFLARASTALAESLDYETTLARVARLAVPDFADWCAVDLVDKDGTILRLATSHEDSATEEQARDLFRKPQLGAESAEGVARVIRTGQPECIPEISLTGPFAARSPKQTASAPQCELKSAMILPLSVRGQTLGAVTFALAPSGRRYERDGLVLAEELARRCALALDNARLYREAQEAVRARDVFLSVAAHELRTPITSLRGFAQLALRQLSTGTLEPARARQALGVIDQQSDRLARLVSQLLDVSRIDSGKLVLDRKVMDLAELIDGVIAGIRARTQRDNLVVLLQRPLLTMVDTLRFEQVVTNLVDNAIKYGPEDEPIEIELLQQDSGTVLLKVGDRGAGIPLEHREQIFDRYYQSHSGHLGGMGLGLYISRQIVDLHGGRIWVECPPVGGTRFVVMLPVCPEDPLPNGEDAR